MKDYHKSIKIRGVHIVNYFNWEEQLDKLYKKIVPPVWPKGRGESSSLRARREQAPALRVITL